MDLSADEIERNQNAQYFKSKVFECPVVGVLQLPEFKQNFGIYFAKECTQSFQIKVESLEGNHPAILEATLSYTHSEFSAPDYDDGFVFHLKAVKDQRKNATKFLNGQYKLEFLDAQGIPIKTFDSLRYNWLDLPSTYPYEEEEISYLNLRLLQDEVFERLGEHDPLTIRLTFTQYVSQVLEYPNAYRLQEAMENKEDNVLARDLGALFHNANDTDAKIKTRDGVTFSVHKLILKMRVPVFRAMFETDMKEKDGIVESPMSSEAMTILLYYIYTGRLHNDWRKWKGSISEVLDGAKQYGLEGLLRYYDKMLITLCNDIDATDLMQVAKVYGFKQAERDIAKWQRGIVME